MKRIEEISQQGHATVEFLSTFVIGTLLVSSTVFVVWLVALKVFLQALVFEASALAAHNFSLSFNNGLFLESEGIRNDLKATVGKFPFLAAIGLSPDRSRFELSYVDHVGDRKFSEMDLLEGRVDAANIVAVQASFYFCLNGLTGERLFLPMIGPESGSQQRDCLGQYSQGNKSSRPEPIKQGSSAGESKLRLLYVSGSHATLQSLKILRNGLSFVDMSQERELLYVNAFRNSSSLSEMLMESAEPERKPQQMMGRIGRPAGVTKNEFNGKVRE